MEKFNKNFAADYEKLTKRNQRLLKAKLCEAFGFTNTASCYYIISGKKQRFTKLEFDFITSLFEDLFEKQLMN